MMERPYNFEELLSSHGYIIFTCIGTSMMPLLRPRRDIVEIRPKGNGRCRKYDVVLYKRGDRYIIHRILQVKQYGYNIAGDHNTYVERNVTDKQILGVITRIFRDGKEIDMTGIEYKMYVIFWCRLYLIRMFILRVLNGWSKVRHFLS